MKTKRTAGKTAQMAADRKRGMTIAEIGAKHGVGVATAHAALKKPSAKAKVKPRKPAETVQATCREPLPPPTREELASFLGAQVRALRADLEAASDDSSAKAAINRNLVATQGLLSRVLPPEPLDPQVGVFVDAAEMAALGADVAARFEKMVDLVLEGSETWERCHACGHLIQPSPEAP